MLTMKSFTSNIDPSENYLYTTLLEEEQIYIYIQAKVDLKK